MGLNGSNLFGAVGQAFGLINRGGPTHFGQGPNGLLSGIAPSLAPPLSPIFSDQIPDLSGDPFLPPFLTGIDSVRGLLGQPSTIHFGQGPNGILSSLSGFLAPPLLPAFSDEVPDLSGDPFLPPFLSAIDSVRQLLFGGTLLPPGAPQGQPANAEEPAAQEEPAAENNNPPAEAPPEENNNAPADRPESRPEPAAQDRTVHTVVKGDTLSKIMRANGIAVNAANIKKVADANGIDNPDLIFPGQEINLTQFV